MKKKMEELITNNHDEIAKECYAESSIIAVDVFWTCHNILYSEEDPNKHGKFEI